MLIAGDAPPADDLGEAAYFAQTLALRDRLASRGRIHLRGPVDRPGVLLAAADALVLDSFAEGWPMANTMEALCLGLPVVMADVAGALEQVGDGSTDRGIRVPNPLGDPLLAEWESIARRSMRTRPTAKSWQPRSSASSTIVGNGPRLAIGSLANQC